MDDVDRNAEMEAALSHMYPDHSVAQIKKVIAEVQHRWFGLPELVVLRCYEKLANVVPDKTTAGKHRYASESYIFFIAYLYFFLAA